MERIVIDKINYLVQCNGYYVDLAYYGTSDDTPFFHINNDVNLHAINGVKTDNSMISKILSIFYLLKAIRILINDVKPDVIINANAILVSWILPFIRKRIPKIVELHFSFEGMKIINKEQYGKNFLKKWINHLLRKWIYPLYDKCVLLTKEDLNDWHFKNAIVIPNFTNIKPTKFNTTDKRKTIINVGRLTYQKNQQILIDAWSIVSPKAPDWNLEIWGNGELYDSLKTQISSLGLNDKVKLMGVSNQIEDIYSYASFFVLSSRYEGQPLVMIEALQSSLPCVCFAVNGVRGTIINGENGYIIEDMTAKALANGILNMIKNENKLPSMAINAKKSAEVFEKELIMKHWIELFESLRAKS
ncbi:MAG: glycosyltransferase [Bacteroidales bacterium]|nr:glycosyltransferase [Bacteroidales bacterium]